MVAGVTLWTAHVVELGSGDGYHDFEIAIVHMGEDEVLAAAPIFRDREKQRMRPGPNEVLAGMYAEADELLDWLCETDRDGDGSSPRDLLEAILQVTRTDHDIGNRGEVVVFLRPWP